MSNFQDISMQWLHFVNELHCYKGKENKKQLLNITQVLCNHNIVTLKDISYSLKKVIIAILTTLFTREGGGGGGPMDPNPIFSKLGAQSKTNHAYLKTTYKTRNLHGCFDFFYLDLQIKFLKRRCLGSNGPPPLPQ